jgi:flagellar protein FliS
MNINANRMVNAYGQVQVGSGVATASPHKLIVMLFDGALLAIAQARVHLQIGDIPERGTAISKAIAIIDEGLKISIDLEAGGELAQNLRSLYEYMSHRLLEANLKADDAMLAEVEGLLKELKSAWDAIGEVATPRLGAQALNEPPMVASSYGAV